MEFSEIVEFVRNMKSRDHVILIASRLRDRREVLFEYIKAGIEKGESAAFVVSRGPVNRLRSSMAKYGVDVAKLESEKALRIIDYRDWYIIQNKFDYEATMGLWRKLSDESRELGFKGLRVVGETDCFFENDLIKELLEYEYALHRVLDIPMAAICAYDSGYLTADERSFEVFMNLLNTHSNVIMIGANRLGATTPNKILVKIKL